MHRVFARISGKEKLPGTSTFECQDIVTALARKSPIESGSVLTRNPLSEQEEKKMDHFSSILPNFGNAAVFAGIQVSVSKLSGVPPSIR